MEAFLTAHFRVAVGQSALVNLLPGREESTLAFTLAHRWLPAHRRSHAFPWGAARTSQDARAIAYALTPPQAPVSGVRPTPLIAKPYLAPRPRRAHGRAAARQPAARLEAPLHQEPTFIPTPIPL